MAEIVADNISIIQSDDLEGATRLDAEYYQPKYLETITLIGMTIGLTQPENLLYNQVVLTNRHP